MLDVKNGVVFWAKGCRSFDVVAQADAPVRVRALVRAAVDGYNERIKDVVLVTVAQQELDELGLLRFVRADALR